MNKESLEKVKDEIIKVLENTDIDIVDKAELMINLVHLLENYEKSIKILQKRM